MYIVNLIFFIRIDKKYIKKFIFIKVVGYKYGDGGI